MKQLFNVTIVLATVLCIMTGCSDGDVVISVDEEFSSSEQSAVRNHDEGSSSESIPVSCSAIESYSATIFSSSSIEIEYVSSHGDTPSSIGGAEHSPSSSANELVSSEFVDTGKFKESIIVFNADCLDWNAVYINIDAEPENVQETEATEWTTLKMKSEGGNIWSSTLHIKGAFNISFASWTGLTGSMYGIAEGYDGTFTIESCPTDPNEYPVLVLGDEIQMSSTGSSSSDVLGISSAQSYEQTSDVAGLPVTINRTDFAFPGGKWKTLVLSFDDGVSQDERLIEIFNETKVKGSFHVTTRTIGMEGYVSEEQIQNGLYSGHEVSSHTKDHVPLKDVSRETVISQVGESIMILEDLVPGNEAITSMAYAGSLTDDQSIAVLKEMGMVVARGTSAYTGPEFGFPQDMLNWFPNSAAYNLEYMGNKLKERTQEEMAILFSWGHSYEFDGNAPWGDVTVPQHTFDQMRTYCANVGGRNDMWYAGAGELGTYLVASMAVQEWKEANPHADAIHNPTNISVWAKQNGILKEIPAGQTVSY